MSTILNRKLQTPACDACSEGVMDTTNSHWRGTCPCRCHLSVEELRAAWEDAIDKHSDYIRIAHVMDTIPNPEIVRQLAQTQDAACEAYMKAVQR